MVEAGLDRTVEERLRERLAVRFGQHATVGVLKPAGHYPRFHVAADVSVDGRVVALFLKCLKPTRKEIELATYERVLPLVETRTPRLLATFPDWEYPTQWLALERVEGRWLDRGQPQEVEAALEALGHLHGQTAEFPEDRLPVFLHYPNAEDEKWEAQILADVTGRGAEIGLGDAASLAAERNLEFLRRAEKAFTHGDIAPSNLLVMEDGICLMDFETARWASPAVDVGNVLAWLPHQLHGVALSAYRQGIVASGGTAPDGDEFEQLVAHGRFRSGLRTIGLYMERTTPPPRDWYEAFIVPQVERVNELAVAGVV